jgi:hypothetical protein
LLAAALGHASTVVDFENLPSLSAQPNNFFAAGAMQTYTSPGVFSISGGVVLGNPTFLTAFPAHGTQPNLYGTTDIASSSLLSTITLTLPAAEKVVLVEGVLFNGQDFKESYIVAALSGASTVTSQTFNNMPASTSASDFANFLLTSNAANPLTQVTVTTPNSATNGWDFLVDTISITAIPEPSSGLMVFAVMTALLGYVRRKE